MRSALVVIMVVALLLFCSCAEGSPPKEGPYLCGDTVEIKAQLSAGFAWLFYEAGGYTHDFGTDFYNDWEAKVRLDNGMGNTNLIFGQPYKVSRICHY